MKFSTICFSPLGLRSITGRTTLGAYCATRMPAMLGSSERSWATRSRRPGSRSSPSMSTASRGGLSTKLYRVASFVSDSMVTRV